jgi:hypothetical protein
MVGAGIEKEQTLVAVRASECVSQALSAVADESGIEGEINKFHKHGIAQARENHVVSDGHQVYQVLSNITGAKRDHPR